MSCLILLFWSLPSSLLSFFNSLEYSCLLAFIYLASSPLTSMLSRLLSCIASSILVGLPNLTSLTLLHSLSAKLSTAILEGALTSTFIRRETACKISSTRVLVLPVPGGPWIIEILPWEREEMTAFFWLAFRDSLCHFDIYTLFY
jgi:hypothetical protein